MTERSRGGAGKNLTKGRARRALKVGEVAASVSTSYAWEAIKRPFRSAEKRGQAMLDTHVKNAMRIVESSKELKGAFMKLVQLLSMRDDILPDEALKVLSVVQSNVPPMDYDLIREQVKRELGNYPEKLYAAFDEEAFAAASLGQVHRATMKSGEDVVVKIQYPGVDDTVEQDLKNVKALLASFTRLGRDVMRQKIDYGEVYRELEERLREELDYVNEAKNIRLFRKLFRDDDEVIIPEVHANLSSRRVLTMSFIDGYPLVEIMKPGVDQKLKDWVAIKLFRIFWRQTWEFGVVHTDPHPGNYVVTYHPKIGMLDFGSIRILPDAIRRAYHGLAVAIMKGDEEGMADSFVRLGFLNEGDDPTPMIEIMHVIFEPVLVDQVFDPRKYDSLDKAMKIATIGLENRLFNTPGHRVFLDRALLGLDSYLKQLGTVANWHRIFKECVDAA